MATASTPGPDFNDLRAASWEEEALFARGYDGQLIRYEGPRADDVSREIVVNVDGLPVTLTKAVWKKDSQGKVIYDEDGKPIPRDTTIYDAVGKRYPKGNPVPILCHQDHMQPVGVCRVCCVHVTEEAAGGKRAKSKLMPSCCTQVAAGMTIHTHVTPDEKAGDAREKIKTTVRTVLELLSANHLTPEQRANTRTNELARLVDEFGAELRDPVPGFDWRKREDTSSDLVYVDYDACILCNRCMRGCNEIKHNNVIGKTGKGYRAQIAFDLNDPMGLSSCVSCGECMFSCPTDALTLRPEREFQSQWSQEMVAGGAQELTGAQLEVAHPLFTKVARKFLDWNASAAVRRRLEPGEVLCQQDEHGSTAYLILSGRFGIFRRETPAANDSHERGLLAGLLGSFWKQKLPEVADPPPGMEPPKDVAALTARLAQQYGTLRLIREPKDVILGEMSCLNYKPRSATVVALDAGCEIIEIRRNILYMLQRDRSTRDEINALYKDRALEFDIPALKIFSGLSKQQKADCVELLRQRMELYQVEPGRMIFEQGAESDCLYIVRSGYVRFWHQAHGKKRIVDYQGAGKVFGEIGLMDQMPDLVLDDLAEVEMVEKGEGRRTLNCNALDHVELLRIDRDTFRLMLERFEPLQKEFARRYREHKLADSGPPAADLPRKESIVQQGVFNAQEMLVLDLARCTRCDECSKACADTHRGATRLIRDGLRIENYLIASACRACEDPYCLVGCPVDAIHRGEALDIRIESHCIGCGLCAQNCPYGNINMVPDPKSRDPQRQKATTCDLCTSLVGTKVRGKRAGLEVSCVNACPHEAAFRMDGAELWERLAQAPQDEQRTFR